MNITISKKYLNDAIQHVSKAIASRPTIEILNAIKIDVNQQGVILTASDTEISIQSFIPLEKEEQEIVNIEREGSIVLPAKFFVEMIRKLPEEVVHIEVKERFATTIQSGSTELQLSGLDPEEYPLLPRLDDSRTIQLPSDLLKSMIRETVFAVSTNESTPILTGVKWSFEGNKIQFTATNRHRLANSQSSLEHMPDLELNSIVISGKTLNELYKLIPDENILIDIIITHNQVLFKLDSTLFYTKILEGNYPDTSKIIPQSYQTELVINKKMLLEAIDRAYVLSREEKTNIVKLMTIEEQKIEISSILSELGKITDQLHVDQMSGEPLKISFNSKYMLEALKVMESEYVYLGFMGEMSPIIIKAHESEDVLHLILPYRTSS